MSAAKTETRWQRKVLEVRNLRVHYETPTGDVIAVAGIRPCCA